MSFDKINYNDLQVTNEQAEINELSKSKVQRGTTQEAEIFTKIVYGEDVSKYGKKVDAVMDGVKTLAKAAEKGDTKAKAELNAIRTVTISQPLEKRLSLNDVMGTVTRVGANEELRYEVYELQGEKSRIQASSGSFPFPTVKKRTGVMNTQTATGGVIVDYRELASGATDGMAMANEQVLTDITNQMVLSHINALRNGIKNATTLKNYKEGITKTNVEDVRKKARRFAQNGKVTVFGEYASVDKLSDLAKFDVNSAGSEWRFSEAVMNEIMNTGLVKNYNGTLVVEMPNMYNLTELNSAGDFYKPLLPTSDLWFMPTGIVAPLQIGIRGGLTSMTATDINLRAEVTRYDLEYGNYLVPEYVPMLGYIFDPQIEAENV